MSSADESLDALARKHLARLHAQLKRMKPVSPNMKRLARTMAHTSNDDSHVFTDERDGVILGVYGAEDWIIASFLKKAYTSGRSVLQLNGTWLTDANFDLGDWVRKNFDQVIFFEDQNVLVFKGEEVAAKIRYARSKIAVEIIGNPSQVHLLYELFGSVFRKAENLIEWVYSGRGESISVPLNYRPAIRAAYPWINDHYLQLDEYIDEYLNSEASVLILIGPPGTGKTTFIKNLIHRSKADAKVAYDPKVMADDGFFAGFIGDESRFLIMEDADEFLRSRKDDNLMMHKFLNLSDGLISAADKKLVFSTNLPDIHDIDEALMRPGRCFDVLQFRELTRAEAQAVKDEVGDKTPLRDGDAFSLASIFSTQPTGKLARRKVGFV